MQVRKFWLENANGTQYPLTDKNSNIFLNSPSGLGFTKSLTTTRLGNEEILIDDSASMPQVSGELIFRGVDTTNIYSNYQAFIQFAKIKPLKLHYITPNTFSGWYIDCVLAQLDKGQVDSTTGLLHCPFTIYGTSFWKTDVEHDLKVEYATFDGKTYPYEYPYTYSGNTYAQINLTNNGTLPCGFKFEINDEITNPVLSLYQNESGTDVKYGEIKILGTYDKIRVDTRDSKQEIYLEYNGSVIANPTAYFDLSGNGSYSTPFPKLKVGENKLTFAFGGIYTQPIHIKWQDIFLTE